MTLALAAHRPRWAVDFHGLRMAGVGTEGLLGALETRFARFPRTWAGPWDIEFEYRWVGSEASPTRAALPPGARPVYESPMGTVHYHEPSDAMVIATKWPIAAVCSPAIGRTTVTVAGSPDDHSWALSHPLLTIPLIEILKRRQLYSLHAAAVALGGKGLLIAGSSGAGKSTLALALARAGFGVQGDDMVFLQQGAAGLRTLGFPEAFDVTDDSVAFFPDLHDVLRLPKTPGWPKRQIRVEERYGAEIVWSCRPSVIVFPRIGGSGPSHIEPMDPQDAMLELVPNILLCEAGSSQRHLDVLGALVASCECYRLETGTDFPALARRLRALLEAAP